VIRSPDELETFLGRAADATTRWIVKADHGHGGLANRRLRGPRLAPADRRWVVERLDEDDCLVVEPWLDRERDLCVVFDVPFDPRSLRIHETACTRDGALVGARFDPDPSTVAPWTERLATTAERVARRLAAEGYFGPVCLDAFSWRDGGRTRLRPLVDLNARLAMSDGAYRLWRRLAPDRVLYYRFFARRRLELPDGRARLLAALGPHRYDRSARTGVLLVSPLEVAAGGRRWTPAKLATIFVARDRAAMLETERWFRQRFEI
jgi:hypothetical protein